MKRLAAPLALAALLTACPNSGSISMPAVDAEGAESLRLALPEVPPEMKPKLAAKGLAEIETGRLPAPFIEGLHAMADAPPDQMAMLLSRSLAESMDMLDHLCGDGAALMQSLATMEAKARAPAVFEGCNMEKHGLVTRGEMPSRDAMGLLLGHLTYDHLKRGGELHPGERAAIEALVSVPADIGEPAY